MFFCRGRFESNLTLGDVCVINLKILIVAEIVLELQTHIVFNWPFFLTLTEGSLLAEVIP